MSARVRHTAHGSAAAAAAQAKRVKQVLSANSEAPLSVEELHNGIDFRSRISREDFEGLTGGETASPSC